MQQQHDEPDLRPPGAVAERDEADRGDVVRIHDEVVLVLGLDELVAERRVEPHGQLRDVHAPQQRGRRARRAAPHRHGVVPRLPRRVFAREDLPLNDRHGDVHDQLPPLVGELAQVARAAERLARPDHLPDGAPEGFRAAEDDDRHGDGDRKLYERLRIAPEENKRVHEQQCGCDGEEGVETRKVWHRSRVPLPFVPEEGHVALVLVWVKGPAGWLRPGVGRPRDRSARLGLGGRFSQPC